MDKKSTKCYLCKVLIGKDRVYTRAYKRFGKTFCSDCKDRLDAKKRARTWLMMEMAKYGKDEEEVWNPMDLLFVDIWSDMMRGKLDD